MCFQWRVWRMHQEIRRMQTIVALQHSSFRKRWICIAANLSKLKRLSQCGLHHLNLGCVQATLGFSCRKAWSTVFSGKNLCCFGFWGFFPHCLRWMALFWISRTFVDLLCGSNCIFQLVWQKIRKGFLARVQIFEAGFAVSCYFLAFISWETYSLIFCLILC